MQSLFCEKNSQIFNSVGYLWGIGKSYGGGSCSRIAVKRQRAASDVH